MLKGLVNKMFPIALPLLGSAILLISCGRNKLQTEAPSETLMTLQSDTLVRIGSENGDKNYRFFTPLLEEYKYAAEPYMEFRRGIDIVTYDSLGSVRSTLVADYAINFTKHDLWEAKGNVKATNEKGDVLETQQLFWNRSTGKIYSNINTKVTQGANGNVIIGEGFESDENFEIWEMRKPVGRMLVNVEPTRRDSTEASAEPEPLQERPAGEDSGSPATPPPGEPHVQSPVRPDNNMPSAMPAPTGNDRRSRTVERAQPAGERRRRESDGGNE